MNTYPVYDPLSPLAGEGAQRPGALADIRLKDRALRHFPLTPEIRARVVKELIAVLDDEKVTRKERIAACKALIAAEHENTAQQRNALTERGQDTEVALAALRATLRTPAAREVLHALTDQLNSTPPDEHPSTPSE